MDIITDMDTKNKDNMHNENEIKNLDSEIKRNQETKSTSSATLFWIHILIVLAIMSIPLWPRHYLEYGIYIPALMSIIWVICDGCPISKYQTELEGDAFVLVLMRKIYPSITAHKMQDIITALLTTITLLSALKLQSN